jgi:hypothetical protein
MPCMPWKVVLEVGFCIGFLAHNGVRRVVPSATRPDAWISFTERIIPWEFKPPQRLLAWLQRVFVDCSTVHYYRCDDASYDRHTLIYIHTIFYRIYQYIWFHIVIEAFMHVCMYIYIHISNINQCSYI